MLTAMKEVKVQCYSGRTYAERPEAFIYQGETYKVKTIDKEWREPGDKHFHVYTINGNFFELCYNEQNDKWSLINPGGKEEQ